MTTSGIYPGEEISIGKYTAWSRVRAYGLGCVTCRNIIDGPPNPHDGFDTRLKWEKKDWPDGTWDYIPLCPNCRADLELIGCESQR